MLKITSNDGKNGNHPHVTLWVGMITLSFVHMPYGDCTVEISGENSTLGASFRVPTPMAGGKSHDTHMAIAQIIDASERDPELKLSDKKGGIATGRRTEDFDIELTARLQENILALELHDPHGRFLFSEKGEKVSFEINLDECPQPLRRALINLPYAMRRDCERQYDRHAVPMPAW